MALVLVHHLLFISRHVGYSRLKCLDTSGCECDLVWVLMIFIEVAYFHVDINFNIPLGPPFVKSCLNPKCIYNP